MAITHTHRVILQDFAGEDARMDHRDSAGSDFGHDDHVAFMKKRGDSTGWEHTHEGVEERYDALSDQISLHPMKTKEELAAEQKVEEAQVALDKARTKAGVGFRPESSLESPVLDPHPFVTDDVAATRAAEDSENDNDDDDKDSTNQQKVVAESKTPVVASTSSSGTGTGTGTA